MTCPCGKKSYTSSHKAKRSHRGLSSGRLRTYRCDDSGEWHVTFDEKNRRKIRRKPRKPKHPRNKWEERARRGRD